MLRLPVVSPRSGHFLIALLLAVKLVLLVWNAAAFDGKTYDADYHADRALFGGLQPGKLAHDGPVYYLPALLHRWPDDVPRLARATQGEEGEVREPAPRKPPRATRAEKQLRGELLDLLRRMNVIFVGLFYVGWIYVLFPRLAGGFSAWFVASLLLLALPGYQRLAVMSHPDNLLLSLSSIALCVWVLLRERWRRGAALPEPSSAEPVAKPGSIPFGWLLGFALSIGLLAATRMFGFVPAIVLSVLCVVYLVRSVGRAWGKLLPRLALLLAIVACVGVSWQSYNRTASGESAVGPVSSYLPSFERDRSGFDRLHYYASFKPRKLLREDRGEADVSDSFFSLLYSEIWGDQWLGFATAKGKDVKDWPRRALLGAALAVPAATLVLFGSALWELLQQARKRALETSARGFQRWSTLASELEPELVLLALLVLGGSFFLWWQGGPALLPGDNSTVKFGYVATLLPLAIALIFTRELKPIVASLLSAYFLALYVLAFPLAMYWPS